MQFFSPQPAGARNLMEQEPSTVSTADGKYGGKNLSNNTPTAATLQPFWKNDKEELYQWYLLEYYYLCGLVLHCRMVQSITACWMEK